LAQKEVAASAIHRLEPIDIQAETGGLITTAQYLSLSLVCF